MNDPYAVLGIARDAGDDEVKNAYRELARKYHPDNYLDNPLSDLAEDRMKEINEAYDEIMAQRRGGQSAGGGYSATNNRSNFQDIRAMVAAGRLEEALELLDGVPPARRDAEWYFLNGSVLYKRGWFDDAYTCFSTACRMNPENQEYRAAREQLERQRSGSGFGGYNQGGAGMGCTPCDMCAGMMCADCCCHSMGCGC